MKFPYSGLAVKILVYPSGREVGGGFTELIPKVREASNWGDPRLARLTDYPLANIWGKAQV